VPPPLGKAPDLPPVHLPHEHKKSAESAGDLWATIAAQEAQFEEPGIGDKSTVDEEPRLDLLTMSPTEFEHVVRELFLAIGVDEWATLSADNGGVDAVAVGSKLFPGGTCLIQAKRYKRVIGVAEVHALAGVMSDQNVSQGAILSTSRFTADAKHFAARNGITLIDGPQLGALIKKYLNLSAVRGFGSTVTGQPSDQAYPYAEVLSVLSQYDLEGLLDLGATPEDEYGPEAVDVADLLRRHGTLSPTLVAEVWDKWFNYGDGVIARVGLETVESLTADLNGFRRGIREPEV
jgi:hypothetical protein